MRDDDDRVGLLELVHEVLDPRRRDRVERGRGLVHEDDVGLDREAAGDAEALLLSSREAQRAGLEPVLDLVPERRLLKRAFDAPVEIVLPAEDARAEGDVVVDRLRKRVRLLEDHADALADFDRVDLRPVEVEAVVEELAVHLRSGDEVVHAVEAADERALAAARGADHRRHLVRRDVERDAADGGLAAVRDLEVAHLEDGLAASRVSLRGGLGQADWVGDRYHLFW